MSDQATPIENVPDHHGWWFQGEGVLYCRECKTVVSRAVFLERDARVKLVMHATEVEYNRPPVRGRQHPGALTSLHMQEAKIRTCGRCGDRAFDGACWTCARVGWMVEPDRVDASQQPAPQLSDILNEHQEHEPH